MPRPFNRYPLGLLGLLDAKIQGRTPSELSDFTQATIDIERYLLEQAIEVVTDTTAVVAAVGRVFGVAAVLTVPQDELWYVHQYAVRPQGAYAAATTYRFAGMYEANRAVGTVSVGSFVVTDTIQGTTSERPTAGNSPEGFIAGPGDRLGAWFSTVTLGTSIEHQLLAKFTRLRV